MINFYLTKYSSRINNLVKISGSNESRVKAVVDTLFTV